MKVTKVKHNTLLQHYTNYFPECLLAWEETSGYGCPLNLLYSLSKDKAHPKNCTVLDSTQDYNTVGEQRERQGEEIVRAAFLLMPESW